MERNKETLNRYQFDIEQYRTERDNKVQLNRYNDTKTKPSK